MRRQPHDDPAVRATEEWLSRHFREPHAVAGAVAASGIPERSLKRRFKAATGTTLINHVQNLRIEEAKTLLETTDRPADEISSEVGYEDSSFFRRLFKRRTGLSPSRPWSQPNASAPRLAVIWVSANISAWVVEDQPITWSP